ncbi:MAG: putative Zn-dependent protease, partial [Mariniblastus sp.]
QAKFHVEQAYQMDNKMVVVLNNLAWYIAHDEVPDLPRALELIELAVSQNPDEIRLRSTYGTVLMKLGRDQEAARELELSLTGVMNRKEVHRKLAILYENLGSSEMASIHRENSLKDDD